MMASSAYSDYDLEIKIACWKRRSHLVTGSPSRRRAREDVPAFKILLTSPQGSERCLLDTRLTPAFSKRRSPMKVEMESQRRKRDRETCKQGPGSSTAYGPEEKFRNERYFYLLSREL